jgi:hypothetical protein
MIDMGGEQTSPFGSSTRVNRMGNHFAIELELPPIREEPDGRTLSALLRLAKREGALYRFPQPGLAIGVPGSPVVDGTVAGGTSLPLRGLTPHYAIRFGQFLSLVHAGVRYLHSAAAAVIADASGEATVTVDPMLRTNLSDGDTVELAKPMIEGWLGGDSVGWRAMTEPFTSYEAIVITEGS